MKNTNTYEGLVGHSQLLTALCIKSLNSGDHHVQQVLPSSLPPRDEDTGAQRGHQPVSVGGLYFEPR